MNPPIFVCVRGLRPRRCRWCKRKAAFQCDRRRPRKRTGTCDAYCCPDHVHPMADDRGDYCPDCYAEWLAAPIVTRPALECGCAG